MQYQNSLVLTLVYRGRTYSHTTHITRAGVREENSGWADEALHNTVAAINMEVEQ